MTTLATLSAPTAQGVRTLCLNRPAKANALSAELVDEVHARLDGIGPETRVLVVRGEGRNFCAGFDFTEVESQSAGDLLLRFVRINDLLVRLRSAPYLTMAWVSGAAYGAGADLVCACAVRVGAGTAKFRFPGFQFGVALGTRRLGAVVGADRARRILLGNEELDTEAALQCGLLSQAVAHDGPDERAAALARTVRRIDGDALATLYRLTDADSSAEDLADLVRSVSRPGLHERIAAYRSA